MDSRDCKSLRDFLQEDEEGEEDLEGSDSVVFSEDKESDDTHYFY